MSSGFIETNLSNETLQVHRAFASLQEELEAIDFYHQRVNASHDESLKAIMAHNRDEEMEHAAMLLEWLRRTMPRFDVKLREFLFTTGPIVGLADVPKLPAEAKGKGPGNQG
jgi:ferritin-like protein